MLNWQFKHFNDLSLNEFHDIIALRIKVFVVEQNCPYLELDGKDKKSYHLICRNGKGELVGTMRILPQGVAYNDVGFGRVVLDESARGEKEGHQMIEEAMAFCKAEFGDVPICLSGQKHLEGFYNKHNFYSTGKEYLEDGIPHVEMSTNKNENK
ncbi:GNAT family N-acetyltransferase [Brumimicrobium mesophilum]|uniref:GNAT family N-acetyltransferase n=1 Tax=Brumimicrobium mesophilum TaxID=392717 RepID=UPI000D14272D|nr:GNAT family N-acetyltransferase [Brumimicrobium mesophilum]